MCKEETDLCQPRFGHPDLANLGQSRFVQSILGSGVCHGGAQRGRGPEGWAAKPPRFHTTAREPKRAHLRVPTFINTTKSQRGDTQRSRKSTKWEREREKRAKFWAVRRRECPVQGGPAQGGLASGGPGESPTPTPTPTPTPNQHQPQQPQHQQPHNTTQKRLANKLIDQNWIGPNWPNH